MKTDPIEDLSEVLKADRNSPHRKYPDQAIYALRDDRIARSINQRFGEGTTLVDIKSLGYDFYTGLNRIYFEFTASARPIRKPDAILVLMNADCQVVGIVDPFNPIQPSRLVAELPQNSPQPPQDSPELPFVLSQPTASRSVYYMQEDLEASQQQSLQFFSAISPSGPVALPLGVAVGPGGLGGPLGGGVLCNSSTTTSNGHCRGPAMVCKQRTGLFGGCDAWDWAWFPDQVADD